MTTLVQKYINGLRNMLRSADGFPAVIEDSPVRAYKRDEQVVSLMPGAEKVVGGSHPKVTRQREIHLLVHTSGDEHTSLCELIFEAAHPLIMKFSFENIIQVDEVQTDEPRYANGDMTRQVVTRRYLITYQTFEDSLSH